MRVSAKLFCGNVYLARWTVGCICAFTDVLTSHGGSSFLLAPT